MARWKVNFDEARIVDRRRCAVVRRQRVVVTRADVCRPEIALCGTGDAADKHRREGYVSRHRDPKIDVLLADVVSVKPRHPRLRYEVFDRS